MNPRRNMALPCPYYFMNLEYAVLVISCSELQLGMVFITGNLTLLHIAHLIFKTLPKSLIIASYSPGLLNYAKVLILL